MEDQATENNDEPISTQVEVVEQQTISPVISGSPDHISGQTLNLIAKLATDPAVDAEKMATLMEMHERNMDREARLSFERAFNAMKPHIPDIVKTNTVSYNSTNYKYEDLHQLNSLVDPILAEHGFTDRWRSEPQDNGKTRVFYILTHVDGHFEETALDGVPDNSGGKNPIQGVGSAVSYLMRYTKKLGLGIAAAADNDGRGATPDNQAPQQPQAEQRQQQASPALTGANEQVVTVWSKKMASANDEATLKDVGAKIKAASINDGARMALQRLYGENLQRIRTQQGNASAAADAAKAKANQPQNQPEEFSCKTCGEVFPAAMVTNSPKYANGTIDCPTPPECG